MRHILVALCLAAVASPAIALPLREPAPRAHWECVPFARAVSGVELYGDAHTWWGQAQGRYARGHRPRLGAVLAFIPRGSMRLGHVATVSEVIDERTVLLTHANWSPINGRRGQIERDVRAIDTSARGDWSEVRVWFGPLGDLGTTAWPTHGFIYADKAASASLFSAKAPKLDYAPVWRMAAPRAHLLRPTGRLTYLGETLAQMAR